MTEQFAQRRELIKVTLRVTKATARDIADLHRMIGDDGINLVLGAHALHACAELVAGVDDEECYENLLESQLLMDTVTEFVQARLSLEREAEQMKVRARAA